MGICLLNTKPKIVVKQYKGENALELLDLLKKRFQIVQDNVKQAETTVFNTMSMKENESTAAFVNRLIDQVETLASMGEEVFDTRKMTCLKEGIYSRHPQLSMSLAMQYNLS